MAHFRIIVIEQFPEVSHTSFLQLDPAAGVPIYRQIVEGIEGALARGELSPGDKLPAVRELAQELSAASGTVKRAYDELYRRGVVEMTQGKGTFIAHPSTPDSRKERAMLSIDAMLDQLEALAFSPQEIQIFLDLKLRERLDREEALRLAVISPSPEVLRTLPGQLASLAGTALYPMSAAQVLADPALMLGEMDLAAVTGDCFDQLSRRLPEDGRLVRLCLRPSDPSCAALARLEPGSTVAAVAESPAFARRAEELCRRLSRDCTLLPAQLTGQDQGISLPERAVLLIPAGVETALSPGEREVLLHRTGAPTLRLELEPDEGSLRALDDAICRALALRGE